MDTIKECKPKVYDGYYSPSLDKWSGHATYKNPDGQYVDCTEVVTPGFAKICKQEDAIYVGKVTEFIRSHDCGELVFGIAIRDGWLISTTDINKEPVADHIILAKETESD